MTSSMYQPLDNYFIYNLVKYKSIRRFKMMSLDPTDSNKRIVHPVKFNTKTKAPKAQTDWQKVLIKRGVCGEKYCTWAREVF